MVAAACPVPDAQAPSGDASSPDGPIAEEDLLREVDGTAQAAAAKAEAGEAAARRLPSPAVFSLADQDEASWWGTSGADGSPRRGQGSPPGAMAAQEPRFALPALLAEEMQEWLRRQREELDTSKDALVQTLRAELLRADERRCSAEETSRRRLEDSVQEHIAASVRDVRLLREQVQALCQQLTVTAPAAQPGSPGAVSSSAGCCGVVCANDNASATTAASVAGVETELPAQAAAPIAAPLSDASVFTPLGTPWWLRDGSKLIFGKSCKTLQILV
eukprot:TRINITY_DN16864_c0_g2_i2.p2 TRINITY_DN16864_c0_g2~~TRINITY_DN16864_c0_g2_i2.p2  ORF type:complete len:275 (-),score=66.50 TRINITY_DN16864_c0_g2_i2:1425-2249(-)